LAEVATRDICSGLATEAEFGHEVDCCAAVPDACTATSPPVHRHHQHIHDGGTWEFASSSPFRAGVAARVQICQPQRTALL